MQRFISTILILSLLACPLWCSFGLCCDGAEFAQAVSVEETVTKNPSPGCCCGSTCPEDAEEFPEQEQEETPCQGICGGAVHERPANDLNDLGLVALVAVIETIELAPTQVAAPHTLPANPIDHAANHGRFLRTLYASWVC